MPLKNVCVERNSVVTVPGFEQDVIYLLNRRGIKTLQIPPYGKCPRKLTLRYSALRKLGIVTDVSLDLYDGADRVAFVHWNSGRGAGTNSATGEAYANRGRYHQLAEAMAGLFGELRISGM